MVKIRKKSIYEMLFAIVLVLNGQSMWSKIDNVQGWFPEIVIIILGISVIGCITMSREKNINLTLDIFKLFMLSGYLLIYAVFKPTNIGGIVRLYLSIILIGAFVFCMKDISGVLDKYRRVILLIAVVSLFFWIFGSILSLINPTGEVYSIWSGTGRNVLVKNYYNIYFQFQRANILSWTMYRNIAFWCEAPMAAFHFAFAFLIEILNKKRRSNGNILILIIAILSTFSMTGYVMAMFGIVMKYFIENPKKKVLKVVKTITIPVVLIIAGTVCYYIYEIKAFSGSGLARFNDFVVGYKVWKNNFLFGVGYGNYDEIKNMMPMWRSTNTGFSNAITLILAYGGIYWGIGYIGAFIYGLIVSLRKKKIYKFSIILIFIIIFCVTNIPYIYLSILIVLAALDGNTKFVDMDIIDK